MGFARSADVGDGIEAYPVWSEPLVAAVPSRHPLLAHRAIPMEDLLRYPLVMCHPDTCEGHHRQIERVLRTVDIKPKVAERATSMEMMLALVGAGYGVGFVSAERMAVFRHPDVVVRPLAQDDAVLTTYLLTKIDEDTSERLEVFIECVRREIRNSQAVD